MPVVLQNDTASTLRVGVAAGDTTLVVASGQGSRFPTLGVGDYFYATLEDTAGNKEIVEVTARTGDTLTATRGAESTIAREFPAGATIEMRVTAAGVIDAAADAVNLPALGVTASVTELNILDGVTASTAELNRLAGVTWPLVDYNTLSATVAELNLLDGVTASTAELNKLDGVTASTAELNKLDGLTASTAELNKLDGVTWTLTAYNTLTASAAELNALDGVTSVGTNIVRAADAAAQRTVLGLGSAALMSDSADLDLTNDPDAAARRDIVKAYVDPRTGRAYAESSATASITSVITFDNTIPQISEGTQVISATYTPTNAGSRLRCRCVIPFITGSGSIAAVAAMFNGNTDAIQMAYQILGLSVGSPMVVEVEYAPGVTTAQTISVRVGVSAGTAYINQRADATGYGTAPKVTLTIDEIMP